MTLKKLILLLGTLFIGLTSLFGQYRWDLGIATGTGNYLGDIGGEELTRRDLFFDMHVDQTKLSSHLFARYRLNNILSIRGSFGTVFLGDNDVSSIQRDRVARNAHFRNTIYETSVQVQGVMWARPNLLPYRFRRHVSGELYGVAGLTFFTHNPQARITREAAEYQYSEGLISTDPASFDYDMWYDLRGYVTEGVAYSKSSISIPMGVGAAFTLNKNLRLAIEIVWSLTFTDYLDDVSSTYADTQNLSDIGRVLSSPTNLDLINTLGESNPESYIQNHQYSDSFVSPRGNPGRNDAYGVMQVSLSKIIKTKSSFSRSHYGKYKRKQRGWKAPRRNYKARGYNKRGRARF